MNERETAFRTYLGISELSPEGAVLRLLIQLGVQVVGADEGSLLVLDEKNEELVFAMTTAGEETEKSLLGTRLPLGEGITGLAAATREVQIGAPTYDLAKSLEDAGGVPEPEAVLAAPMLVGESLIGVITAVSFDEGKRFRSPDAELYATVASIGGVVVQQRRRIKDLESLAEQDAVPTLGDDDAQARIIGCVTRLARSRPDHLERVAGLLGEIEALCDRED
ncbi:MAG: GAF domain-containing protein [Planctomycetota bacterium]|jgi:GAF domain-containing protein